MGHSARSFRVWSLFPRFKKSLPVHRSEDLSLGQLSGLPVKVAQPLSLPPPPSLISGISPGSVPPKSRLLPPPQGQAPRSLWNFLPREAGVCPTAILGALASAPSTPNQSKLEQEKERERNRRKAANTMPATPGHSLSWLQKSINQKGEGTGLFELEPIRGSLLVKKGQRCSSRSTSTVPTLPHFVDKTRLLGSLGSLVLARLGQQLGMSIGGWV